MARPAAAVLLLLVAGAGCLSLDTTYPAAVCAATYPDGERKDCHADDAVPVGAPAASGVGWTCRGVLVDDAPGWELRYELWQADDGEWRLSAAGHGSRPAGAVLAHVTLHDADGVAASRIVGTRTDGWVALGPVAGIVQWAVWAHAFTADGPEVEVRATSWGGNLWVVYADPGGAWAMDGTDLPQGGERYLPVDRTFSAGEGVVTVEQDTLMGRVASIAQLAPLPGLGLPCDGPV